MRHQIQDRENEQHRYHLRRILPNGSADRSILRRVARVFGVLQWEDTNERGNVPESFGMHNTVEQLPVPDGWMMVEFE